MRAARIFALSRHWGTLRDLFRGKLGRCRAISVNCVNTLGTIENGLFGNVEKTAESPFGCLSPARLPVQRDQTLRRRRCEAAGNVACRPIHNECSTLLSTDGDHGSSEVVAVLCADLHRHAHAIPDFRSHGAARADKERAGSNARRDYWRQSEQIRSG